MHLTTPLFLIALVASNTLAELCTLSTAVSVEEFIAASKSNSNSGSGSGSGSSSPGSTKDTLDTFQADQNFADMLSQSGAASGVSTNNLITSGLSKKRQTVTSSLICTTGEACFSLEARYIFCLNVKTADYHDQIETKGNLITGNYTLKDGTKGNSKTGTVTASVKSATVSATATAAVAKATLNGGVSRGLEMGPVGVLGLVVGVLLA